MKMSLVVEGFRADAMAVGELGDEVVSEVADRIGAMLARSAPSRVLDILSTVAAELSAELPGGRVEIRLAGDDVELAYVDDRPATSEPDAELSARISLRLSEHLKTRVEQSATREGISVNAWILRALERGASTSKVHHGRAGSRLRGFGTS